MTDHLVNLSQKEICFLISGAALLLAQFKTESEKEIAKEAIMKLFDVFPVSTQREILDQLPNVTKVLNIERVKSVPVSCIHEGHHF